MMNFVLVAALALAAPAVMGYDAVYDKLDVDKILADDALFNSYIDCMLDKAPCTVEHSADFRKILPEVIATSCEKCTDIQKVNVRKSVKALQERKPKQFQEFREKFDPKGEHETTFTAFILGE